MTGWAVLLGYLMIGTAVGTETLLRIRGHWLKGHPTFSLDREDLGVTLLAALFWPLTLVVGGWLWLHDKREGWRGPEGEG